MDANQLLELLTGASMVILTFVLLLFLAFIVFYLICLYKLFKKAGKKGWEAFIPYYNTYVLVEISGLNWWYFLIAISGTLLSIIGINSLNGLVILAEYVVNFFIFWNLAKKMHKKEVSIAILGTLFPGVMVPILGLSKEYNYDSSVAVSPNGPIGDTNNSETNNNPERFCLGCGQKLKEKASFCENCGKKIE